MKEFYRSAGEIVLLPMEQIEPNPVRRGEAYTETALSALCDSITENGLLDPIRVMRSGEERFRVIDGERRRRAAELTGMEELPCVIVGCEDDALSLFPLIENGQRQSLHYLDEAEMLRRLLDVGKFTVPKLAQSIGVPITSITEKLRLLNLSEEEQMLLRKHQIPESCALLLASAEETRRTEALEELIDEGVGMRQLREMLSDNRERQRGRIIFKNVTVFTNTVERAVETMRQAGVPAEMERTETSDKIKYTITVSKFG